MLNKIKIFLLSSAIGLSACDQGKFKSTVRYLGIEVDDAIELAEKINI